MTRPRPTLAPTGAGTATPSGRVRALLAALVLVASLALGGLVPVPAQAAPDDVAAIVDVRLTSLSPDVTRPGDTLTVVVEIENTGATEITSPVVELSVSRIPFATRNALVAWEEAGLTTALGSSLATAELPAPLPPGGKAAVTLEAPADSMKLRSGLSGWGPRGLSISVTGDVAVVDDAADAADVPRYGPLGVLRTYVLWFPVEDTAVNPVQVSVLVPVVGPPVDTLVPATAAERLAQETVGDGRLARLLASTQELPGVTLAVDPALATPPPLAGTQDADDAGTEVAPGTGTDPSDATPEDAVDPAAAWVAELVAQTTGRETYALPRFDQDWGALADAGLSTPIEGGASPPPAGWRTDLAWPAEDVPDGPTLDLAVRSGAPNVVVGPTAFVPDTDLTYTPTGRATASTPSGDASVLVPDTTLSALLESPAQRTPAAARQRILAELSVISRERPGEQRHVLVTASRGWSPVAATARAQLAAMTDVPWASLEPVSTLMAAADPGVDRSGPAEPSTTLNELTPSALQNLASTRSEVAELAGVVPDPAALTAPLDEAILAITSVGWRSDTAGRAQAIQHVRTEATALTSSVTVLAMSDYTLISTGSSIRVTVRSALEQPATVVVALAPDDPRLVAEKSVTVTVPAGAEASVSIPVKAIGSGDVSVGVEILTPGGTVLAQPYTFGVRVRADWETMGTVVVTAMLVLLLAGGVWRTIHRGRSDRRASAAVVEQLELSEQTGELSVLLDSQPSGPPPPVDPHGTQPPDDRGPS